MHPVPQVSFCIFHLFSIDSKEASLGIVERINAKN